MRSHKILQHDTGFRLSKILQVKEANDEKSSVVTACEVLQETHTACDAGQTFEAGHVARLPNYAGVLYTRSQGHGECGAKHEKSSQYGRERDW